MLHVANVFVLLLLCMRCGSDCKIGMEAVHKDVEKWVDLTTKSNIFHASKSSTGLYIVGILKIAALN